MTALYHAHSGLRYLVLLVGVIALLVLGYGLATRRPIPRARILAVTFTGLLDLQIVLGVLLVAGGIWYAALMGHLTMMLLAAVLAHGTSIAARRSPDEHRALGLRFAGVLGALVCIALGIVAIGRSIFGTAVPTL